MHGVNFQALFNASPNAYLLMNRRFVIVGANQTYLRVTGRTLEGLVGLDIFDAFPSRDANGHLDGNGLALQDSLRRAVDQRKRDELPYIHYAIARSTDAGDVIEDRYWSATHTPLFDIEGEVEYVLQHTEDITEIQVMRKELRATRMDQEDSDSTAPGAVQSRVLRRAMVVQEANQVLQAEASHLRRLFEEAPGFMCFLQGPNHVYQIANAAYYKLIGRQDVLGKPIRVALPELAGQGMFEMLDKAFADGQAFVGIDLPVQFHGAGGDPITQRYVDVVCQPVIEPDGRVSGIFVQGSDVTQRKLAQEELVRHREHLELLVEERTAELEASEAQRRQALKMEAVGRLTGGIAHDFNNVLQVIGGNLQLLRQFVDTDDRASRRLASAMSGVERGAKLASQLLSFARKQPLEPVVLNAGVLLNNMDDILRRALGESIELETVIAGGLWNVHVDRNQLENALLNLAINARDAMDGDGRITLETNNASLDDAYAAAHEEVIAGQYVMIAVSDTGSGMTEDVMARAFEPFFTTKPDGKGSGLGLSMVYGFVKQSGGHLKIYSEVGHGTTIKMYLPRVHAVEEVSRPAYEGAATGGTETVLVVEDDAAVRATAVDLLVELGYHVLKAHDAQSALAVIDSGVPIDVLFTDVVMPGPIRSPELARRAKAMQPRIEVLFTSGYTENAIVHGGRLDPGVALLGKPYRREDLARKLRHVLAGREHVEQAQVALNNAPAVHRLPGTPVRVLVVEDNADALAATLEILDYLGYPAEGAATAEAAMDLLAAQRFDVLLADVELAGTSGVELATRVREQYGLHVVFASGYPARQTPIPDAPWLQKPFTIDDMSSLLIRLSALPR
jgi:PAS domain S-box-containing protein